MGSAVVRDVADIVRTNEVTFDRIKLVFLKGQCNPRRLLICFGAMGKGFYSRLSWYWQETNSYKDAYLFLSDPTNTYYFGRPGEGLRETYEAAIEKAIADAGVSRQDVALVGNSMGGYASIYYGVKLGLGVSMASNPQVDRESARINPSPTWLKCMQDADGFIELTDLVRDAPNLPFIYLEYGRFSADVAAARKLTTALAEAGARFAVTPLSGEDHHTVNPNRGRIEAVGTFAGMKT